MAPTTNKKRGQPSKGENAKSMSVSVRVTPAEHKRLTQEAAQIPGSPSVGSYVRWLCIDGRK